MLTMESLDAARIEYDRTRGELLNMCRSIIKLREGNDPNPEYVLSGYRVAPCDPSSDDIQHAGYDEGTELMFVDLVHHRWCDSIEVVFPTSYLDGTQSYVELERVS